MDISDVYLSTIFTGDRPQRDIHLGVCLVTSNHTGNISCAGLIDSPVLMTGDIYIRVLLWGSA